MECFQLRPIGRIETPYRDKFGVPRQAGLVPSARGRLVLDPPFQREEAFRGIGECSHLWLVFLFDKVGEEEVRLSVRPPRLGGNEKLGVFASRSPYRPNRIGISACRFHGVETDADGGMALILSGVDLIAGTPVVDVKPYLPYADMIEGAWSNIAPEAPERWPVQVAEETRKVFEALPGEKQQVVLETLALDARPAFHEKENRSYFFRIYNLDVGWKIVEGKCILCSIRAVDEQAQ